MRNRLRQLLYLTTLLPCTVLADITGLDSHFAKGAGWLQAGFHTTPSCDSVSKVLELADGNLLVAGSTASCSNMYEPVTSALWRFHTDGSIDTAFSHNGILFKPTDWPIRDMLLQPDGKIVLAGQFGQLVRLLPDGQSDPAFHLCEAFVQTLPSAATMRDHREAAQVIQQQDGKLVSMATVDKQQPQLARFNTDGSCDTSFNNTGRKLYAEKTTLWFMQILQQADGKIVVAGSTFANTSTAQFALMRFNPDGSFDTSFNKNGIAAPSDTSNGNSASAATVIQQSDGKLIAAGLNSLEKPIRFNSNGSVDSTFTVNNIGQKHWGKRNDKLIALPDNLFMLAFEDRPQSENQMFMSLSRFQPDGKLDTSFGYEGTALVTSGMDGEHINNVILLRDGSSVLATNLQGVNGDHDLVLYRALPDGKLDSHFGQNGVMRFNTGLYTGTSQIETGLDQATTGLIQADGKIVLAGTSTLVERDENHDNKTTGYFAIARFLPDGQPDTSFHKTGTLTTAIQKTANIRSILQQTDGKLVAVGESVDSLSTVSTARYNTDGTLDTEYGQSGIMTLPSNQEHIHIKTAALLPDNAVLVAGTANGKNQDVLLLRFSSAGVLDTSFGQQGKMLIDIGTYSVDQPAALLIAADGSFFVAGTTHDGTSKDWFVLHYSANGTLDTTFNHTGRQIIDFGEQGDDSVSALLRQPDGKFLLFGSSQSGAKRMHDSSGDALNGKADSLMALARLNADGTLDSSFNKRGWARYRTGTLTSDEGIAMQLQADGNILITGRYKILPWAEAHLSDWKTTLMRIQPDGTLDSSFHNKGKITWALRNAGNTEPATLLRSPDDHLYIGGTVQSQNFSSFYLLQADGTF